MESGEAYYRGDGLHAQHERVLGQVPRVRERVLLPELAEEGLQPAHGAEVDDVVPLEEEVDAPAEHEPQEGE